MKARVILKTTATLGALAIIGQMVAYTFISRHDVAGTSNRPFSVELDEGEFFVRHPNTWEMDIQSREPEFRLLMQGPQSVRIEVIGSVAALVSLTPESGEEVYDPLPQAHRMFQGRVASVLSNYTEDESVPTSALPRSGIVSFFNAEENGSSVRGARYTMIGSRRAWLILAVCPEDRWSRSVPVINQIVRSMELR